MLAEIISEEEIEFLSSDSVDEENGSTIQIEYLNTLNPAGLPPHQLRLKKNVPIMLLRNIDLKQGHCNGVR